MTLGIALLLIFILYLIDKHNRWRIAAKLTAGLIVVCILAVGGFFGRQKYEAWQQAHEEARQDAAYEAEHAKEVAQKQAELAKTCKEWEDKHPIGSPLNKVHGVFVPDPPQGCVGPSETDYNENEAAWLASKTGSKQPIDWSKYATPPNCEVVACSDWGLVTGGYGSRIESRDCFNADLTSRVSCEDIAVLKKGDMVQILSDKVRAPDGSDIYETKFQQWTGWVSASDLSPEKTEEK